MTGISYNLIKSPYELKPHPLNRDIYGEEQPDNDLQESIRNRGILEPIVIRDDNVILSGHRRWVAAKAIGLDKVPCRVLTFSDVTDEEEALIEFNRQRQKTFTQKMREADHLQNIYVGRVGRPSSEMVPKLAPLIEGKTRDIVSEKVGMSHGTFDKARKIWDDSKNGSDIASKLVSDIESNGKPIHRAYSELLQNEQKKERLTTPDLPPGKYKCLIIDPPWDIKKIIRNNRPNQDIFPYATLSDEEIGNISLDNLTEDNAHLYLWTTHKKLPVALKLVEKWGFKYQCLMTWVKNVGFTPFSWMYSTEHVLFCKKGNLDVLKKGVRLDFTSQVREHSRKPDIFYEIVKEVSPGPRIDLFSRELRDGFDSWGNEISKFNGGT